MPVLKFDDDVTGWTFDYETDAAGRPPPGGIALTAMRHAGHNYAKDMRTVGIWIELESVDTQGFVTATSKTFHTLSAPEFTASAVTRLKPLRTTHPENGATFSSLLKSDAALYYEQYFKEPKGNYVAGGLTATYEAPALFAGVVNCDRAGLVIEQVFLFSPYGNLPPHEPSGGLVAARFHPLIRYTLTDNPAFDATQAHVRVGSIRFDYRFHLCVDSHYEVPIGPPASANNAGFFADSDSGARSVAINAGLIATDSMLWGGLGYAMSRGAFVGVEKPVVLEMVAPGLGYGLPVFNAPRKDGSKAAARGWDNVHVWGVRGPGKPIISAPGAFHCFHMHWRWGGATGLAPLGHEPQFDPRTFPAGMPLPENVQGAWGPLVDPGIFMQTLRLAVVKYDAKQDPAKGVALSSLTQADFESQFASRPPEDISRGDDIVLWYSTEVHQQVFVTGVEVKPIRYLAKPSGTVFLHGIFFAHDAERWGVATGSTKPDHRPRSEAAIRAERRWFRPVEYL